MALLQILRGLPADIPLGLGKRTTQHEDERRRAQQAEEARAKAFERDHFAKGKFFEAEARKVMGDAGSAVEMDNIEAYRKCVSEALQILRATSAKPTGEQQ